MEPIKPSALIDELAQLAARHKIVPFLGAGASINHLGVDWDALGLEMANELSVSAGDNIEIAEQFVNAFGMDGLCSKLSNKLIVSEYDENKDITPLIIISMASGLVYTTNQDNVFDACAQKYGRSYKQIVILEDLGNLMPGERALVKYHGDLNYPDSIIFTKSSYLERIGESDHFLNIRMRSDLLAKSFLFVGYSFRDPNIIQIFEELNSAFRGTLPPSYLIAYSYSPDLEKLNHDYGVKIIDPTQETIHKHDKQKAFEVFMSLLLKETCALKTTKEISDIFRPSIPHSVMVATKYDIECIENIIGNSQTADVLAKFRATFDAVLIPHCYHERVCDLFVEIAKNCKSKVLSDQLNGAAFNLSLESAHQLEIISAVSATAQFRDYSPGTRDIFLPSLKNLSPPELRAYCTARAIELLQEWNENISDAFRQHVIGWVEGYNKLPEEMVYYITQKINSVWISCSSFENPIKYWNRLGHKTPFGPRKTFNDIRDEMMALVPKINNKPYEE